MLHSRILLAAFVSTFALGTASAQSFNVKVTNPSSTDRHDVPVVIDLHKALGKKAAAVVSAVVTAPSSQSGNRFGHVEVPSQLDDLDGDLLPDELCFVCDLPAKASLSLRVVCSDNVAQKSYAPRTAAFMKVWDRKYRYPYINSIEYQGRNEPLATYDAIYGHGAQWESELVGFRVYIDHRQSIDIYGKPTPQLVLDKTNFYSTREDIAAGRGCDILFAGASVGAGSFRGYIGGQPTYVDSVEARGQRVIASGPVRAIVEVTDKNWNYNGRKLQMRQRYTIYAGHRDVQVDVQLAGANLQQAIFCTGVQKIEQDNKGFLETTGLAGSWGLNVPDKAAEDLVEGVGLGVCVEAPYLHSVKEDALNYLTLLRPQQGHIRYHLAICALMEQDGFRDSKAWFTWLHQWQESLLLPCKVAVK
ncbi:MAG: DUF4861 domain-containing protein [Bacteroidaceae bacterium]|nr:DUF4861 domain-containing protein [Bacteroidaceae bacterium]